MVEDFVPASSTFDLDDEEMFFEVIGGKTATFEDMDWMSWERERFGGRVLLSSDPRMTPCAMRKLASY